MNLEGAERKIDRTGQLKLVAEADETGADGVKAGVVRTNFASAVGHGPFAKAQAWVGHRARDLHEDAFPWFRTCFCRGQDFCGWQRVALA